MLIRIYLKIPGPKLHKIDEYKWKVNVPDKGPNNTCIYPTPYIHLRYECLFSFFTHHYSRSSTVWGVTSLLSSFSLEFIVERIQVCLFTVFFLNLGTFNRSIRNKNGWNDMSYVLKVMYNWSTCWHLIYPLNKVLNLVSKKKELSGNDPPT